MKTSLPVVTVFCVTFNHDKYIRECLQGIVMQNTKFLFEVIVQDDASTDSTKNIINEFSEKYNYIIPVLHNENQYSKGKNLNEYLFKNAKGKYIALCEGDDYWVDPYKLQKQFDFLESNNDFFICSSNVIVKNDYNNSQNEWLGFKHNEVFLLRDVLRYGSCGATCTLFFRTEAIKNIPDWFYLCKGGDWQLQILATSMGKMKYFNEVFAVYRRNEDSVTSAKTIDNRIILYEDYGIETIKILKNNFSIYENELKKHEAEYWLYALAILYSEKGNFSKARELIIKIFKNINFIELSINKSLFLIYLYVKNVINEITN